MGGGRNGGRLNIVGSSTQYSTPLSTLLNSLCDTPAHMSCSSPQNLGNLRNIYSCVCCNGQIEFNDLVLSTKRVITRSRRKIET